MLKETILKIIEEEQRISDCVEYQRSRALPENCYFLDDGIILCYPRNTGDSRYPYAADGLTLWAYSSGYISLNESTFYFILPADEGKEPYAAFFGGIKTEEGYFPVSITGVARQATEKNVKRFTVYTPEAVYYITKTEKLIFFVRAFVSEDKKAVFSVGAINTGKKAEQTYLSSYLNCLLMHQAGESVETKWFKQCKQTRTGFIFESTEDLDRTTHLVNYGVINRAVSAVCDYEEHTTSRADYAGGKNNSLNVATPLFTGHFKRQPELCRFADTAAAGDLYGITLAADEICCIDYFAEAHFNTVDAENAVHTVDKGIADSLIRQAIEKNEAKQNNAFMLKMKFGESVSKEINGDIFTKFVRNVQRQVEFAALAKNSGVSLLGVRDMVQQAEAALMWNPTACRKKFIEMLNYIDPCGRPPRQYSIPAKGALPQMDTREFIDQGLWIISAVYTYLSFTGDYTLLDEECGYYKITGRNKVEAVNERNSVAEHLKRITEFLIANIDKRTGCLRALYGDWNDALDGLGVSCDGTEEFGTGVSVMASLQLYRNLKEMIEICEVYGDKFGMCTRYADAVNTLKKGLEKFAIETKDGKRKILHGWGDKGSYKVGSFCDVDGKSRDGLTANAFWVISGAYGWDKTIKKDILESYKRLDSKYGLKTFEPHFEKGTEGVGRIGNLPKGTAENGAVYIHATIFGIWSLFGMGESEAAWKQLLKILPLTHKLITTTPFIMSNSYAYNEELCLDGESMSDWFTGSANTLIKTLVWHVFGIKPDLNGVKINPAQYFPFNNAEIEITVKGKRINLAYRKGEKSREFILNGKSVQTVTDEETSSPFIYLKEKDLKEYNEILILN